MAKTKLTHINDDPRVQAKFANLERLKGDLDATEKVLADLWVRQGQGATATDPVANAAVEALLRGEETAVVAAAPDLGESIQNTRHRVELLKQAVQRAEQEYSHVVAVASREHCTSILPEWRAVARPVAEALIALAQALQAAQEFKANLVRNGIEIGSMSPADKISPFDDVAADSALAFRLRDLVEAGVVEPKEIPWGPVREFAARALKSA